MLNPAPVRIPDLSPALSRGLIAGTVPPAAARAKGTDRKISCSNLEGIASAVLFLTETGGSDILELFRAKEKP